MEIEYSERFVTKLKKLSKKNKTIRGTVVKRINQYIGYSKHPSLKLHKLKGQLKEAWSISVDKSIRILFHQEGNMVTFIDIGSHDEVYGSHS